MRKLKDDKNLTQTQPSWGIQCTWRRKFFTTTSVRRDRELICSLLLSYSFLCVPDTNLSIKWLERRTPSISWSFKIELTSSGRRGSSTTPRTTTTTLRSSRTWSQLWSTSIHRSDLLWLISSVTHGCKESARPTKKSSRNSKSAKTWSDKRKTSKPSKLQAKAAKARPAEALKCRIGRSSAETWLQRKRQTNTPSPQTWSLTVKWRNAQQRSTPISCPRKCSDASSKN